MSPTALAGRSLVIEVVGAPFTVNAERSMNPYQRAARVKAWRTGAWAVAKERQLERILFPVSVEAMPISTRRSGRQDVGACMPAVKAIIDGLVDAEVLPGDGADVVTSLTFYAPAPGDVDAVRVLLRSAA
jgi:hypothetical protein